MDPDAFTMTSDVYDVVCKLQAADKVFRRACSQILLLHHKIQAAKTRYNRARAKKCMTFRYTNHLKLTSMNALKELFYAQASAKCEEIEALQAKLLEISGGYYYDFESNE